MNHDVHIESKNMNVCEETSCRIKNMGLICALLVVMIHLNIPKDVEGFAWGFKQVVVDGIAQVAVPFFFAVSGFFLAAHFGEVGWWRREVRKRVSTLLIPFLLWSLLVVVFMTPLSILADLEAHRPFGTSMWMFKGNNWLQIFGLDICAVPILNPLWYVRCLLIFVLISPFINWLVNKLGVGWLLLCFSAIFFCLRVPPPCLRGFFLSGFSIYGLFYFSLGIYIRQHQLKSLSPNVAWMMGFIGLILLVVKVLSQYYSWDCRLEFRFAAVPFLMAFMWRITPAKKWPACLVSCSFPIYVMHVIVRNYGQSFLNAVHVSPEYPVLACGINWFISVLGSIAVACLLRKHCPKVAGLLFGGR